jgi:hypothetical protein
MPLQSDNRPEFLTLDGWNGLNQQVQRGSVGIEEEWWNENLFAIGPGNLRSCWGHGPAIYTTPGPPIRRIFFGFIGNETPQFGVPPPGRLGWMFLDDGNVDQVDLDTRVVTRVGNIWDPVTSLDPTTGLQRPTYWASAKVWRPQFFGNVAGQQGGVLFGSPKGLYAWDGTTLSSPGDTAPDWLTDQAEMTPNAPPTIMPVGLPGIYCMEVYSSRLFVAGKDVISFSAPSNGADFSTTDGGGSFGYFGDKLTYTYNDMAAVAGYLFVFGDSSIDLINNVQLTGSGTETSPFLTSLSYTNVDPQVGQRFPRPVGRIGHFFQTFNGAGIFELQGGEAREIGQKLANTYMTLDTTEFYPTMAPATMFNNRVLLCNGKFTDPWGRKRSLLLMWHPQRFGGQPGQSNDFWSVASQNLDLTNIGYYEQDSVITPYGTDGTSLYQLFAQPDPALPKRLSTGFLRGGTGITPPIQALTIKYWKRLFMEFYDKFGRGVSFTGKITTKGGGIPGGTKDIAFEMPATSPIGVIPADGDDMHWALEPVPLESAGIMGAIDLESVSPDFVIERLHIAVEERTLWGA